MENIIISILEKEIRKSKVEYRNDMKGVVENMYKITLYDRNDADGYGLPMSVDFICDSEKFLSKIDEDKNNGKDSKEFYINQLIETIKNEFKRKYRT